MSIDRAKLKAELASCLGQDKAAGEMVDCVARYFVDVEAFREGDDLVVKGGSRFLAARRIGPDRFRVSENVWAPSTNMIDFGGGTERTLDQLIDEISTLSQ